MKTKLHSYIAAIVCLLMADAIPAFSQGSAFSYDGRLNADGSPAQGIYDFRSAIYNAETNGTQIGGTLTNSAKGVTNGLFNLPLDFGPGIFTGPARWLEIGVRTNGGVFTNLTPRTALLATPYAVYAATASGVSSNAVTGVSIQDGTITVAKLASGQVVKSLNGLTDNVTLSQGANVSLTTNGNTIQISSSGSGAFSLSGTNAYYNLGNVGIGTTTPSTYGHGGTAKILEVNNSGTTLNSQAHLMLFSGVNSLLNSAMGTVTWAQPGGMAAYIGATTRSSTPNVPTAKLTFGTRNIGDGAAVARMTIMEDGKVGIGTTSPAYLLDVNGVGNFNAGTNDYALSVAGGGLGGVLAFSVDGDAVAGKTAFGAGVAGYSSDYGDAIYGISVNGYGVYAGSTSADGVYGYSSGGNGVHGVTSAYTQSGVAGVNTVGGYGVAGFSDAANGTGVYGRGANNGVFGYSPAGDGVYGQSSSGAGVTGSSSSNDGVYGSSGKNGVHGISTSANGSGVWGDNGAGGNGVTGTSDGSSGIGVYGRGAHWAGYFQGNVNVTGSLNVGSSFVTVNGAGGEQAYLGGDGLGADIQIGSQNPAVTTVACYNTANNAYMHLNCSSITIFGGADLAEPFQITAAENEISQGAVVVIDEENPGHLKLSDRPYDTRVAGIVSGANGINPGIQMQQKGLLEGGKNISLTGRVYVLADASSGAIKPGDLLTTSNTPGHAMKVTNHNQAQGSILGKAMSSLSEGKGMVLVLVTLQ